MCKLGVRWLYLVIAGGAASTSVARADFLEVSPRSLAMGDSLRAAATGALAVNLNPSGIALSKTYVLEGDYAYRPDDHTNIQMASICDSITTRVGACLAYNHLSSDYNTVGFGDRSRHEFSLTSAAPLGDNLTFGGTIRYVSYSETAPVDLTNRDHDGFTWDLGMTYRLMGVVNVGAAVYNLTGDDDANYARALGYGVAFNVTSSFLVAADGRYDWGTNNGHYGGGAEYMFSGADGQQGVPLRAGYVYDELLDASYITAGIGLMTPRVGIDIAIRQQLSGTGSEFMIQGGLRIFFPN